jgi:hypothetical protein
MWYQTGNSSEIDNEFHSFVNRGILCSGYKYPEDGGDLLLRNVGNRVQDCRASQPIKQHPRLYRNENLWLDSFVLSPEVMLVCANEEERKHEGNKKYVQMF